MNGWTAVIGGTVLVLLMAVLIAPHFDPII